MSKKNARIKAMRMKVPVTTTHLTRKKNKRSPAVVIRSDLLNSAAGLSTYIAQTSSQRGAAGKK